MGLDLGRGQSPCLNPEESLSTGRKKQTNQPTSPSPPASLLVSVLLRQWTGLWLLHHSTLSEKWISWLSWELGISWRTLEGLGAKWGFACGHQGNPWSRLGAVNTGVRFGTDHRGGSAPPWGIHGQNFSKGEVITPPFHNAACAEGVRV